MVGMMEDEYMAKFKMLTGRTGFNGVALEDAFIWGLLQPILSKVYSQTSLLFSVQLKFYTKYESCMPNTISCSIGNAVI